MIPQQATRNRSLDPTSSFLERALIDFELLESFYSRPWAERDACVRWIDAALDERAQEEQVSQVLDSLAFGWPLPRPE